MSKRKDESPIETTETLAGKGKATPTRKQAEAARQRPLVAGDRKEAKRRQRERQNEYYAKQREAMETGDPRLEKYLSPRDQGPVRRFVRDYVDARWSIGELFLPLAFLILIAMMLTGSYPALAMSLTAAMYLIVLAGLLDAAVLVFFLKRRLKERFDADQIPKWTGFYAFSRAFMLRRFRMPRPQVKRGEWPHKQGK